MCSVWYVAFSGSRRVWTQTGGLLSFQGVFIPDINFKSQNVNFIVGMIALINSLCCVATSYVNGCTNGFSQSRLRWPNTTATFLVQNLCLNGFNFAEIWNSYVVWFINKNLTWSANKHKTAKNRHPETRNVEVPSMLSSIKSKKPSFWNKHYSQNGMVVMKQPRQKYS